MVWLLAESSLIVDFDQILHFFLVSPIPGHFVSTFDDQCLQLSSQPVWFLVVFYIPEYSSSMHVIKIHCFSVVDEMITCFEGQIVYYKFAMEEITVQTELTKISYCLCHHAIVWLLLAIDFQAVVECVLYCNVFLV